MTTNQRLVANQRAMAIVCAYESHRGARVTDVSSGNRAATEAITAAFARLGTRNPSHPSADLISTFGDELRVIEVKSRGSKGPIQLPERQMDTLTRAGAAGCLYVVWNATQPGPYELWVVCDPARLDWIESQPATRPPGSFRNVGHEAKYKVDSEAVERAGACVDLTGVPGLPAK